MKQQFTTYHNTGLLSLCLVALLVIVNSCKTNDNGSALEVTGVKINTSAITMIVTADTLLSASVIPTNAVNQTIYWSSSNDSIAIVDDDGFVTALSIGTANIIVTTEQNSKTDTCVLTVINIP